MTPPVPVPDERLMRLGFVAVGILLVTLGLAGARVLHQSLVMRQQAYQAEVENAVAVEKMRDEVRATIAGAQGVVDGDSDARQDADAHRVSLRGRVLFLDERLHDTESEKLLADLTHAEDEHAFAVDGLLDLKGAGQAQALRQHMTRRVVPAQAHLQRAVDALGAHIDERLQHARDDTAGFITTVGNFMTGAVVVGGTLALALGLMLAKVVYTLRRRRLVLEKNVEQVTAANRDLDAFAGRIAHDLKSVLAPLPMVAVSLARHTDDAVNALAARLERVNQRATDMMDALLAFSRAARPSEASAAASVRTVVHDALEDLRPLVASVDAKVETELDDSSVQCSPGLLTTVVLNLLSNALKFLEERPERRVRVTARPHGRFCELAVEDTGPGIPEEAVPKVFEPFFRVPGVKAAGTGIGLATVQRIVHAHDGCVSVQSEVGKGVTLKVWLPLASDGDGAVQNLAPGEDAPADPCH